MRRLLVSVFLVSSLLGCDDAGLVAGAPADGAASLLGDHAQLEQAVIARHGEARLGIDGPWLRPTAETRFDAVGASPHPWRMDPPATTIDGAVVLVVENADVQLVLQPEPDDLLDVARWEVEGGTTLDGATGDEGEGVRFRPGRTVLVDATDDASRTVLARVDDWALEAAAWVPRAAVGKTFDRFHQDPRADWAQDGVVRNGAEVLDAPGGEVLATVGSASSEDWLGGCSLDAVAVLERWGEWTRVQLVRSRFEVDGWVSSEDVREGSLGCFRCGGGWGGGSSRWRRDHTVGEGTPLFDGPGGAQVGVVLRDHGAELDAPDEDGWIATRVPTAWGEATVWIDAMEDYAPKTLRPTW